MKADELERCQKAIRKLAHDLGEHWASRIREDHDRVDEVLNGLRKVARATADYEYCEFPDGCVKLDVSDCLARGGTPVTACPIHNAATLRSDGESSAANSMSLRDQLGPRKAKRRPKAKDAEQEEYAEGRPSEEG
jgi:hypothetical protein